MAAEVFIQSVVLMDHRRPWLSYWSAFGYALVIRARRISAPGFQFILPRTIISCADNCVQAICGLVVLAYYCGESGIRLRLSFSSSIELGLVTDSPVSPTGSTWLRRSNLITNSDKKKRLEQSSLFFYCGPSRVRTFLFITL